MNPEGADKTAALMSTLAEFAGRVLFWVVLIGLLVWFIVWLRRRNSRPAQSNWQIDGSGTDRWRFNPPPGWPPTPPGFVPPAGWHPDPSWPAAPPDWTWWVPN